MLHDISDFWLVSYYTVRYESVSQTVTKYHEYE
jgi:hypothetical protein